MPIEHHRGGTTITGDAIDYFRLCSLKMAVSLELKGIRVRRGPVVWIQVKNEFNITGNKQKVYDWLCAKVDELRPLQEHVEDGKRTVGGQEVQ